MIKKWIGSWQYLCLFSVVFLLLLSSSIKPTESFFEGADRSFSPLISFFSSLSPIFVMSSMLLAVCGVFLNHIHKLEHPVFGLGLIFFLLLKIVAVISYAFFEMEFFPITFSFFIVWVISAYILSVQAKNGGAFEVVAIAISIFACFFSIINLYEYIGNPYSVVWAGRFYGVTNHPNFIGGYSAMMAPFLLWAFAISPRNVKPFCILFFVCIVMVTFFSGSRASVASLLIGLLAYSYYQFGSFKTIGYGMFALFVFVPLVLFLMTFGESLGLSPQRLLLTENTREYVNFELWNAFSNSPVFGNPLKVGSTSNSYLLVLAKFGLVGGLIMILLLLTVFKYLVDVNEKSVSGLGAAYIGALAVILPYSLFEGVLVENFSLGQIMFVFTLVYLGCQTKDNQDVMS